MILRLTYVTVIAPLLDLPAQTVMGSSKISTQFIGIVRSSDRVDR